jgi:glycosyltransferase involved in cell wall biosynthesis
MRIGIDITPLQSPHRMRGIGATVSNFINNIGDADKKRHTYVLYVHDSKDTTYKNPIEYLNLNGLSYEVFTIRNSQSSAPGSIPQRKIVRLLRGFKILTKLKDYYWGDARLVGTPEVDIFLQFDQQQSLPQIKGARLYLVVYDIIPYVLEWDYLLSYKTARLKEHSRKGSLNHALHRWLYIYKLRLNAKRCHKLLSISDQTKDDLVKLAGIAPDKIIVTPLGINLPTLHDSKDKPLFTHHYVRTSWGYMKRPFTLDNKVPFLLFVGGVDRRRKIKDLVTAYNHLRARGYKLRLVMVGDIMQGPENIPIPETRLALEQSSYADDIIYMGYVDEEVREMLYERALTFVYPSIYEGFGLPVLEAMSYGCPVVCYDNAAVKEIAGELPLYANNALGIASQVQGIIEGRSKVCDKNYKNTMIDFAAEKTWKNSVDEIIFAISDY